MAQVPNPVDKFFLSLIKDGDLNELVADGFLSDKEVVQWKSGHQTASP